MLISIKLLIDDWRNNQIGLLWVLGITPFAVGWGITHFGFDIWLLNIQINLVLISIYLVILIGWYKFRNGNKPFINHALGVGDILMWGIYCLALNTTEFISFFLLSAVLGLIGNLVFGEKDQFDRAKIPLVSYMVVALWFTTIARFCGFYDKLNIASI